MTSQIKEEPGISPPEVNRSPAPVSTVTHVTDIGGGVPPSSNGLHLSASGVPLSPNMPSSASVSAPQHIPPQYRPHSQMIPQVMGHSPYIHMMAGMQTGYFPPPPMYRPPQRGARHPFISQQLRNLGMNQQRMPSVMLPDPPRHTLAQMRARPRIVPVNANIQQPSTPSMDAIGTHGSFGWTIVDGVNLPYLLRESKQYISVRMLEQKLLSHYPSIYPSELRERPPLISHYVTPSEASLLNEINAEHCALEYGPHPFKEDDLVVKLEDFESFYNVVKKHFPNVILPVENKGAAPPPIPGNNQTDAVKVGGTGVDPTEHIPHGGWVLVNTTVVPYLLKNQELYVPLSVIRYAAGLLNDVIVERILPTIQECEFLNRSCQKAGLKFLFAATTRLVTLLDVKNKTETEVLIQELAEQDPFSHAERLLVNIDPIHFAPSQAILYQQQMALRGKAPHPPGGYPTGGHPPGNYPPEGHPLRRKELPPNTKGYIGPSNELLQKGIHKSNPRATTPSPINQITRNNKGIEENNNIALALQAVSRRLSQTHRSASTSPAAEAQRTSTKSPATTRKSPAISTSREQSKLPSLSVNSGGVLPLKTVTKAQQSAVPTAVQTVTPAPIDTVHAHVESANLLTIQQSSVAETSGNSKILVSGFSQQQRKRSAEGEEAAVCKRAKVVTKELSSPKRNSGLESVFKVVDTETNEAFTVECTQPDLTDDGNTAITIDNSLDSLLANTSSHLPVTVQELAEIAASNDIHVVPSPTLIIDMQLLNSSENLVTSNVVDYVSFGENSDSGHGQDGISLEASIQNHPTEEVLHSASDLPPPMETSDVVVIAPI